MNLTLITMSQGNPTALRRTLDSFGPHCSQIIYGDLLLFEEDRKVITSWLAELPLIVVPFKFNYIFEHGFSALLNVLAAAAKTSRVVYMNCGEVIDTKFAQHFELLEEDYNCWFFRHETEPHKWIRTYVPQELKWGGLIHEETEGARRVCPTELFYMADTPKDSNDPTKAKICEDVKELCYFQQLETLRQHPEHLGATSAGWLNYVQQQGTHYADRLAAKGWRYQAFLNGSLEDYLDAARKDFAWTTP